MIDVVQIVILVGHGQAGALHPRGIAPDYEVRRPGGSTGLRVEYHLGGTRVHHGRGPDGHDGAVGIESSGMLETEVGGYT